jgi:hypothetical protein
MGIEERKREKGKIENGNGTEMGRRMSFWICWTNGQRMTEIIFLIIIENNYMTKKGGFYPNVLFLSLCKCKPKIRWKRREGSRGKRVLRLEDWQRNLTLVVIVIMLGEGRGCNHWEVTTTATTHFQFLRPFLQ